MSYSPAPDRYESGSPNYPGVVGMLKAMEVLRCIGFDYSRQHEQRLLRKTLDGLKRIPGVILYGDNDHIADRVGIVVFNLRGTTPEDVANMLAGHRAIAVRHAAFCAHPYVRRLTNEPEGEVCTAPIGMVRVSFGIYNTEADVECLLATIREILRSEYREAIARMKSTPILSGLKQPNDRG